MLNIEIKFLIHSFIYSFTTHRMRDETHETSEEYLDEDEIAPVAIEPVGGPTVFVSAARVYATSVRFP
jgi:hypothetical protein